MTGKFLFFTFPVILMFFVQILGSRGGNADAKISASSSRAFNPFSVSSWVSYPSQVLQYWFPLFRPAYYPTHLQRPTTSTPPTVNRTEKSPEKTKPKTENIFGVSGKPDDDVGCLSPGEFEW